MSNENEKDQYKKLHNLLLDTIKRDQELREQYKIGDKFRFIRDRLNALKSQFEENLSKLDEQKKVERKDQLNADEQFVFVYLFNAQGMNLKTWQPMLAERVFYEYSVNRPIYAEKGQIESYLRTKTNKSQNAYLTFIVKKSDIITTGEQSKDSINTPLIKVKEGSLKVNNFISLHLSNIDYVLNEAGVLVRKDLAT